MIKIIIVFFVIVPLSAQQSILSERVNMISDYVSSEKSAELNETNPHIKNVDSIYNLALNLCEGNTSEALLSLTFALVPYNRVPIRVPLLNHILYFPLISAADSIFHKKNAQLPVRLYFDSPDNQSGDGDKLAHFFGSAFITNSSAIFDLGELIGYFVEVFEETFNVQSSIDLRDLQTNREGNLFGKLIKENKNIMPSSILLLRFFAQTRINL